VIDWLWHLRLAEWLIVAGLIVVLVASSIIVLKLWPPSRHWSVANQLHRLATRNAAGLRRDTRRQLDVALRTLGIARRECVSLGHQDDTAQLDRLIRQIETVRDRVACGYAPSPANAPGLRRELDLEQLAASEALGEHCRALAGLVRSGLQLPSDQLNEVREAVRQVEDRGVALP